MKTASVPMQQPAAEQVSKKTLVLKYYSARPHGTEDVTQQYFALARDLAGYCQEHGYIRLQDHTPGIIEIYDRKELKESAIPRYLVIIRLREVVREDQQEGQEASFSTNDYVLIFLVADFNTMTILMHDHLLAVPLLPEILRSFHGIRL